ncbi:signal transduction histidine kinase [Angulomicrobium tetraedrale]|uniref:histidine kinase n=1 Tax=Ancylobacter tetraedralis TaxID=217068 RepID=A0A839ZEI9_9HYPH|nr:HAMP domain-containing sensor histidine kinase [Ancylobacter tetraedralis]MBB3773300.1 signal transduction histidine kinase [Ancylobacter tetraedralis]
MDERLEGTGDMAGLPGERQAPASAGDGARALPAASERAARDSAGAAASGAPAAARHLGLSGKLLVFTLAFVLLAEVLIIVPAVAAFRINWLSDRLSGARTAALVLDAAPEGMISPELTRELLGSVGAITVALKRDNTRRLLVSTEMPPEVDAHTDLRDIAPWQAVSQAFDTLIAHDGRILRVVGTPPRGGGFVEIVLRETPLRKAMLRFTGNILLVSLVIAALTGALVYLGLAWMFVRPMRRLTLRMVAFRENPAGPAAAVEPQTRMDEIGLAEREFVAMQRQIGETLQQKNHLAALGLAVSKINHDLRNLLASVQLISDRLADIRDPAVQRFAPKLEAALDRAIAYCEQTLAYGRAQEPPPEQRMVALAPLVNEVRDTLGLGEEGAAIGWVASIERGMMVDADPDQLFRVLLNLCRNAMEALSARAPNDAARDQIRITGRREGAIAILEVADTGPGVPERSRAHLFEPFQSSARRGGTGLGLPIAAELVQAHGGDIRLVPGTIGATFQLRLPDRPVDLGARRAARSHG